MSLKRGDRDHFLPVRYRWEGEAEHLQAVWFDPIPLPGGAQGPVVSPDRQGVSGQWLGGASLGVRLAPHVEYWRAGEPSQTLRLPA